MSPISGRAGGAGNTERTCLRNDTWIKAAQDGSGKLRQVPSVSVSDVQSIPLTYNTGQIDGF